MPPFDGNGTFAPVGSDVYPAVTTTTINSTTFNALVSDLVNGLSLCVTKDGQSTPTANIPMGGFKLTGLAAATTAGDALRYEQRAGLVYLATATASNSTTVDFTSLITSAFDVYEFQIYGYAPVTAGSNLILRVSEDGGSTFKSGSTNYNYQQIICTDAGSPGGNGSTGDTSIVLANNIASAAHLVMRIRMWNPAGGSFNKPFSWEAYYTPNGSIMRSMTGAGAYTADTSAVNAIRFLTSSGNINTGTFAMYGIRKS